MICAVSWVLAIRPKPRQRGSKQVHEPMVIGKVDDHWVIVGAGGMSKSLLR